MVSTAAKREAFAMAISLDPNGPLPGTVVVSLEAMMVKKLVGSPKREDIAGGVAWTNVPAGGLPRQFIFKQIKLTPSVAVIAGCWPMPLAKVGRFAKYLWTFDWPKEMNQVTADEVMKQFSKDVVLYNLVE